MIGLPYCKGYRFSDMERGARAKTGLTFGFLHQREMLLRKAKMKADKEKEGQTK